MGAASRSLGSGVVWVLLASRGQQYLSVDSRVTTEAPNVDRFGAESTRAMPFMRAIFPLRIAHFKVTFPIVLTEGVKATVILGLLRLRGCCDSLPSLHVTVHAHIKYYGE